MSAFVDDIQQEWLEIYSRQVPHSEPKAHHHPFYYMLITTIFSNPSLHEQNVHQKAKLTKKSAPQTFGIMQPPRTS
jgi:hypothetical protein